MTDVVALAAELLAIDSSTGAESAAIDFVARWLVSRGWNVNLQEVTRGRANVWATRGGRGVTLSTHLDIVPALCEAELMFRLVGPVEPLRERIVTWAQGKAELEWGSYIPAQHFHVIEG